jgi:hypothetical protein
MPKYLSQAKMLLDSLDIKASEIDQVKEQLESLTKSSALTDLINDPKFQNIVNLLTPFVVNYKVNQVLKLLQELGKEQKLIDPDTGLRKFI